MKTKITLMLALCLICAYGCDATVNKSITIADNQKVAEGLSSVNGSIEIGSGCAVTGGCHTVNGSIRVGTDSTVGDLETVNGRIRVAQKVIVDGDLSTVNGSIGCDSGSKVDGEVSSVNGGISLTGTTVSDALHTVNGDITLNGSNGGNGIRTVNGDITLENKSTLKGDIVIKERHGFSTHRPHIIITISGGSTVEGGIRVEDDEVDVEVRIDKESKVTGQISPRAKVTQI